MLCSCNASQQCYGAVPSSWVEDMEPFSPQGSQVGPEVNTSPTPHGSLPAVNSLLTWHECAVLNIIILCVRHDGKEVGKHHSKKCTLSGCFVLQYKHIFDFVTIAKLFSKIIILIYRPTLPDLESVGQSHRCEMIPCFNLHFPNKSRCVFLCWLAYIYNLWTGCFILCLFFSWVVDFSIE